MGTRKYHFFSKPQRQQLAKLIEAMMMVHGNRWASKGRDHINKALGSDLSSSSLRRYRKELSVSKAHGDHNWTIDEEEALLEFYKANSNGRTVSTFAAQELGPICELLGNNLRLGTVQSRLYMILSGKKGYLSKAAGIESIQAKMELHSDEIVEAIRKVSAPAPEAPAPLSPQRILIEDDVWAKALQYREFIQSSVAKMTRGMGTTEIKIADMINTLLEEVCDEGLKNQ
jgi:hypothetical protein